MGAWEKGNELALAQSRGFSTITAMTAAVKSAIPKRNPFAGFVVPMPVFEGYAPVVTNDFHPPAHLGVDLMYAFQEHEYFVPEGDVVAMAAGPGKVVKAYNGPRGHSVSIDHGNGYTTYYTHMSDHRVTAGDKVEAGQALGIVNYDPMDASKVRHLHFELWPGGDREKAIDPAPYLKKWAKTLPLQA